MALKFVQQRGPKLPKIFWRVGYSKFLYPRLLQEKISINFWTGAEHDSPMSKLCRKYYVTEQTIKEFKKQNQNGIKNLQARV